MMVLGSLQNKLHHAPALKMTLLNVLYQDPDYVVIDKPSGLLVHRTALDTAATEFALQMLRDQIGQEVSPCHRLDRPTSGLLLFALNKNALTEAKMQFEAKTVRKEYIAIVRGWPPEAGDIDYDLRSEDNPDKVQAAQTHYRRLAQSEVPFPSGRYPTTRTALLQLTPKTGRKHQLRRHLAHLRHPILGDTRHGDGAQNRFLRTYCGCDRLMLRATHLEWQVADGRRIQIIAPPEPAFEDVLTKLRLHSRA